MATDGPVDCYGDWAVVVVGWALVSGLVRAMIVVMLGILDQDPGGVVSVVDQDAVGALGTDGTHEPLGKTVASRGAWRRLDDRGVLAAEHGVEARGELRVPVPDEEAERADPFAEIHGQIAGGLGDPRPSRMGGHPEDVDPAGVSR